MLTGNSFNGWNIVALPTDPPAAAMADWEQHDTVAESRSPFTGQSQLQAWLGADWWQGSFSMPPLRDDQVGAWQAFLADCRGMLNVFQMGDPKHEHPRGNAAGAAPQVDCSNPANNLSRSTILTTKNWPASRAFVLRAGDRLQIGMRLHMVTQDVSADSNGKASFGIFPSIREAPSDGDSITLNKPMGIFRLQQNVRKWHDQPRFTALGVEWREAL